MDYEDIYNRFEAGGQNVNVRKGRARRALKPVKDSNLFLLQKVDILRKPFYWIKFQKKCYMLRFIVKDLFHFEMLFVTDARADRSWWRYAVNP